MNIPYEMIQEIRSHSEATYPEECCGVVFARPGSEGELTRVRPCRNAQNDIHALEPAAFPRTARTAYTIDARDLLAIEKEKRARNEIVRIIFHSHPDAEAYFSEEDQRCALFAGEPLFPDVRYLVVSVKRGGAGEIRQFEWNAENRAFEVIDWITINSP